MGKWVHNGLMSQLIYSNLTLAIVISQALPECARTCSAVCCTNLTFPIMSDNPTRHWTTSVRFT
jgi:hypothetical protein